MRNDSVLRLFSSLKPLFLQLKEWRSVQCHFYSVESLEQRKYFHRVMFFRVVLLISLTVHTILNKHLDSAFKPFFKKRKGYDWVILVDWFSMDDASDTKSPIHIMMNVMMKVSNGIKLVVFECGQVFEF